MNPHDNDNDDNNRGADEDDFDVDVLFDDNDVLVLNKPAGLAMHGGVGVNNDDSLHGALLQAFDVEPGFKGPSFLGRLDRPTSGLVVACLGREALRVLDAAWQADQLTKSYLAVVHGKLSAPQDIRVQLAARRARDKGTGKREAAHTHVAPLASNGHASLVHCTLHTGRTHQIRRHMKAVGHPLVFDDRYGDARRDQALRLPSDKHQFALHAWRLTHTGNVPILPVLLEAPLSAAMSSLCQALGLKSEDLR